MDILIVTQYFWPENFRINDLAADLVARGHRVTVLTGQPNYPAGKLAAGFRNRIARDEYRGARVIRVPLIPRGNAGRIRLALNYLSFAASAALLGPWLVKGHIDAILVFEPSPVTVGLPAVTMKWWRRAPILFWVQDIWPDSVFAAGQPPARWLERWLDALVRWIYKRCDFVLVQSRAFAPRIAEQGVPADRIRYVPNTAEALYRPMGLEEADAVGVDWPTGLNIVFGGNIGVAQDFESILETAAALRNMPQIHWLIFGDGRHADWVREEIARRGLDGIVRLMGSRPPADMPAIYARADVLLVSLRASPVFALTIPSKIQSYLACGRPILGLLDGEGARVIEEAQAGYAVPSGDVGQLADRIRRLLDMTKNERETLGRNGLLYFQRHFSRERVVGDIERYCIETAVAVK